MDVDLIARLVSAAEGSRELDARIEVAISNWPSGCQFAFNESGGITVRRGSSKAIDEARGRYTTSLDAALRLLPNAKVKWAIGTRDKKAWGMAVDGPDIYYCDITSYLSVDDPLYVGVDTAARTPALAVCIAALKARA